MSDWKECTIGELCETQTGPFGSQLHNEDYVDNGTPIVTVEHLGSKNFTNQNLPCVSDNDKERLSKYILKEGDIVFSRVGSVDRCSYVSNLNNGWLFSGRCLRIRSKDKNALNDQFIYYHFCNPKIKTFIRNIAVGATMPSINTKLMNEVPISLPPLTVQKKIAGILSALDEKIETNRKINARLEEMAHAIFKSWFIDFTPFGGQMPSDWELKPIDEVYSIKYGKNISKSELSDNGYPVYGANGIIGFTDKCNVNKIVTLITSRGNGSGEVSYTRDKDAFITNNSFIVSPLSYYKYLSFPYIFQSFLRIDFKSFCSGSAQPQLTNTSISSLSIMVPTKDIIDKFTQLCGAFYEKIFSLYKESARLGELRDALLPKLMSGEIKIE